MIPESGRSPGEGNGNPLQYSCLVNPMDRGTWQPTVHGVEKSRTWLSNKHFLIFAKRKKIFESLLLYIFFATLKKIVYMKKYISLKLINFYNYVPGIPHFITLHSKYRRLPAMQKTWAQSLGQEDILEYEMATHSSILAWNIPWTG